MKVVNSHLIKCQNTVHSSLQSESNDSTSLEETRDRFWADQQDMPIRYQSPIPSNVVRQYTLYPINIE